jgi:hypothetical protein
MEGPMGETTTRRTTVAEFFDWEPGDDRLYELVDGVPVAMGWAPWRRSQVIINAICELHGKLKGSRCHVFIGGFGC